MTLTDSRPATSLPEPIEGAPGGTKPTSITNRHPSRPAIPTSTHTRAAPGGDQLTRDHVDTDAHRRIVAGDQHTDSQCLPNNQAVGAVGDGPDPAAIGWSASRSWTLLDPALVMAAEIVDDLEKVRIANENRLRQLTRDQPDSDGQLRGFALEPGHPDVTRLAAMIDGLKQLEHQAVLNLQRHMRHHPLGPWVKAQPGIGEKQGARLLAVIGDPYIRPEMVDADGNTIPAGPRTVSALWAYTGYNVVPGQEATDAHWSRAGDDNNSGQRSSDLQDAVAGDQGDPGHTNSADQTSLAGVAPKRRRGQRVNWNTTARMRAYLIAESCVKQPHGTPYRDVYDAGRAKYADATHTTPCVQCGPKGKPAPIGSPLSAGHQHARALRLIAKAVLRDLWREAKRIHEAPANCGPISRTRTPETRTAPAKQPAASIGCPPGPSVNTTPPGTPGPSHPPPTPPNPGHPPREANHMRDFEWA